MEILIKIQIKDLISILVHHLNYIAFVKVISLPILICLYIFQNVVDDMVFIKTL